MKTSELVKLLKEAGCYKVRDGAKHELWRSPKTGKQFAVGRHPSEDVASGTLDRTLKDAGLK